MNCPYCDEAKLRNSRFRASDLSQLFLMRLPVRCRGCEERSYVLIPRALLIRRDSRLRREADRLRRSD